MASPKHFMQATNFAVAVYDRTGNKLAGPVATSTLFAGIPRCSGTWSDASAIYDRFADRWLIPRFAQDSAGNWNLCFAVSQTSDPTGTYDVYGFLNSPTFFNDYPKFGVWSGGYYMTANSNGIFSGIGNLVTAFEREKMLSGASDPGVVTFSVPAPALAPGNQEGVVHTHMLPAFVDGPALPAAGTPNFVVQVQDDDFGYPADALQVYEVSVDWTNPSAATFTATDTLAPSGYHTSVCSPTGSFQQECLPQPGAGAPVLDSLSYGYMMQRLVYRTFADHETLLFNHTISADDGSNSSPHAAIRWYEIRRSSGSGWSIFQQGTQQPDGANRWLGSMAMDKDGDIALGYVVGSSSVPLSIRYVGRKAGDPLGTMTSAEQTLVAGIGSIRANCGFFGDYSEVSIDPKDDCRFWITNTYSAGNTANNEWHTRIGDFRFGSCNNPPVARCQNFTTPANGVCQGSAAAANIDNGSSDPDDDSFSCSLSPTGPFSLGGTPVTLTCTDSSGASGSCNATVTVIDTTPPTLVVPPDKTFATCTDSATVNVGQATATDNCATGLMPSGEVIAVNGVPLTTPIPIVGGQVTLGIGTFTIQWTVSDGGNTTTLTQTVVIGVEIEASQSFLVDDRAQVRNGGGGFAAVLNAGSGPTRIGIDARSGAILSVGPVSVLHRAIVNGNVTSASTVFKETDGMINGTTTAGGVVVLPPLPTLPAFPPPIGGSFTVNSGTTLSRPPNSYANAAVNGGTLILAAGDYFFQNLTINSGSIVRVTPTTRIFVRDTLIFNAPLRAPAGTAIQPAFLGFAGTNLSLNAELDGTLVAPNATVSFGTGSGLTFTGSFFARVLEVTPASALVCQVN
jgi:hypothetical protein